MIWSIKSVKFTHRLPSSIDHLKLFSLIFRRVCCESHPPGPDSGRGNMKLSNQLEVPVYTISGSNTARPLPEWLARRRKRSLKNDPEYANRVELLQDFEFEEASQCVRVSEDGDWVMSTG